MKLEIICVAYKRAVPLRIMIDCFIVQTDVRWNLHIVHDGPAPDDIKDIIALYDDPRITFCETTERHGQWGHPNRKWMLEQLGENSVDYVLITNDDNYYVPKFVEYFLNEGKKTVGFIYCNTVHSYMGYDVLITRVKECSIDVGSFAVRLDMAKKIGFQHMYEQADGRYAEECAVVCLVMKLKLVHIDKPIFIHN